MAVRFRAAIDGGSRGNPGPAAWGVAILNDTGECEDGHCEVDIQADSQLVVRQIEGQYRVRHPDLKPLFAQAMQRIGRFKSFRIRHVRREQNRDADRLVNAALNRAEAASEAPAT
jgi:ribonuclease HI